jgi:hypothetical protein
LVFGGDSPNAVLTAEVYDPSTDTWSITSRPSVERWGASLAVVCGRAFVVGGATSPDAQTAEEFSVYGSSEVFDPLTNAWSPGPQLRTRRYGHAAAPFGGRLFVSGGSDGSNYLTSTELSP